MSTTVSFHSSLVHHYTLLWMGSWFKELERGRIVLCRKRNTSSWNHRRRHWEAYRRHLTMESSVSYLDGGATCAPRNRYRTHFYPLGILKYIIYFKIQDSYTSRLYMLHDFKQINEKDFPSMLHIIIFLDLRVHWFSLLKNRTD